MKNKFDRSSRWNSSHQLINPAKKNRSLIFLSLKSADMLRLLVLAAYGGIYLDNDVYVIGSFNEFRVYEMSLGWYHDEDSIGSQVLIANRNARLLHTYIDIYR